MRLELIAADRDSAWADAYDRAALARLLAARVPGDWPPPLLRDQLTAFAETLAAHPEQSGWWNWYWVRDEGQGRTRILVGNGGFKGPPTDDGTVEIGYSVLDVYQRRGYATEAMAALLDWAFLNPAVTQVVAETQPLALPASVRVLEKLGLSQLGPGSTPGSAWYGRRRSRPADGAGGRIPGS